MLKNEMKLKGEGRGKEVIYLRALGTIWIYGTRIEPRDFSCFSYGQKVNSEELKN